MKFRKVSLRKKDPNLTIFLNLNASLYKVIFIFIGIWWVGRLESKMLHKLICLAAYSQGYVAAMQDWNLMHVEPM